MGFFSFSHLQILELLVDVAATSGFMRSMDVTLCTTDARTLGTDPHDVALGGSSPHDDTTGSTSWW